MNSRPPERRADSAAGACSTVRVVPPPVPPLPPSAVSSRSRVPVAAVSSARLDAQPLPGLLTALRGPHPQHDHGGDQAQQATAMMSVSSTEM